MRRTTVTIFLFLLWFTVASHCSGEDLLVTIGEKTTRITNPLKPDGYPDYLAALNSHFLGKSTPENNLAVGLWKITGPVELSPDLKPLFFRALGIDDIPNKGDYLVDFATYYRQRLGVFDSDNSTLDEFKGKQKKYDDAYSFVMANKWTKESHPEVFQWWKKNRSHIEAVLKITETRDQYYNPYILPHVSQDGDNDQFAPELISIPLPGAIQAREVARTLKVNAHYHLGNNDIDAAMRTSIATHRIGRLTARGGTLIEGLVGVAISGIAFSIDRQILTADTLNAKQLQEHLAQLRSLPAMPSFLDKINLSERYMFLDAAIHVAKHGSSSLNLSDGSTDRPHPIVKELGKIFSSSFVDWDHVLRQGNYWYDEIYRTGSINNVHERTKQYAEFEKRLKTLARETSDPVSLAKKVLLSGKSLPAITSEQISNIMVGLMLPSLGAVISAEDRALMESEIIQIGIVLELHYLKSKSYPSSLKALVGPLLKELPQDRFNEKGLSYQSTPKGYLLYSFGRDRQDNRGRSYDDEPSADDIVLKRQR